MSELKVKTVNGEPPQYVTAARYAQLLLLTSKGDTAGQSLLLVRALNAMVTDESGSFSQTHCLEALFSLSNVDVQVIDELAYALLGVKFWAERKKVKGKTRFTIGPFFWPQKMPWDHFKSLEREHGRGTLAHIHALTWRSRTQAVPVTH